MHKKPFRFDSTRFNTPQQLIYACGFFVVQTLKSVALFYEDGNHVEPKGVGGVSNEMNNTIVQVTDGIYEDRAILKLEMDRLSLKNETNKASKERLSKLENCIKAYKETPKKFNEQWEREKSLITRMRSIKEEINRVNQEMEASEHDCDLNHAAELKYV
ncbi:casein lytic proteinase B4 [Artemisia annua]|uniref:Casein lytic proteinase B4 n=1 Tax=Artemisia annua TaxID=35608 RepID=A0A2U1MLA7_ARTAN|nr:casein lytic proteinase B4 [Artemisia annua]